MFQHAPHKSDQLPKFEFRVCPSFLTKPGVPGAHFNPDSLPTFGPGSDIFEVDPDLNVSIINDTHRLVLNRYCVFRPQYLILTLDSYRRQTELLDESDLAAAWMALQSMKTDCFVIYNCGKEAGCSRLHKHLQMFPLPEEFTLFPDQHSFGSIPFKFSLSRVEGKQGNGNTEMRKILYAEYQALVSKALDIISEPSRVSQDYFAHNVVLTKRWLMVIPRRKEAFQGASANAAGMCGMVWAATSQQVDKWLELGPANILSELGFARKS